MCRFFFVHVMGLAGSVLVVRFCHGGKIRGGGSLQCFICWCFRLDAKSCSTYLFQLIYFK